MSSLVEFAHVVQAGPGEVFEAWLAEHRAQLDADAVTAARSAFDHGRQYQLAADSHALARAWVADPDLRRHRGEGGPLSRLGRLFTDPAALHRESSRVPEKFREG